MTTDTILPDLIERALKKGATSADALYAHSTGLSADVLKGTVSNLERSESTEIGLRVFIGQKQGIISTTNLDPNGFDTVIDRVLDIARNSPDDPYCGLAEPFQLAEKVDDLDLCDPAEPNPNTMIESSLALEESALAVNGVEKVKNASSGWERSDYTLATSHGFLGRYSKTYHHLYTTAIAGDGTNMVSEFEMDVAAHRQDLRSAKDIGRIAGENTVRQLNPRTLKSQKVPVIIDRREARTFLSMFCALINGSAIARKSSFLMDKMGKEIFHPSINVYEDPFIRRAIGSRPFDAEGIRPQSKKLVEEGVLQSWLLDLSSARQLGLNSTGNAARGTSSTPSPSVSNVWIEEGKNTIDEMISSLKNGLILTDMLGSSVNYITGEISGGGAGFWIENGQIAYPVQGFTIAGNLNDIFHSITPASDLERRHKIDSPSLLVESLTIAGQ